MGKKHLPQYLNKTYLTCSQTEATSVNFTALAEVLILLPPPVVPDGNKSLRKGVLSSISWREEASITIMLLCQRPTIKK